MSTSKTNRTSTQGKDQQIIDGIGKDLQTMSTLYLGAKTYSPPSLAALIQSRIDAANKVTVAKAAWHDASASYKAIDVDVGVVVRDLKALVIAAFGSTSPKLADFGFTPRKRTILTPEQKAAAAQKRRATRAARHTLGPKAKLKITGANPQGTANGTPAAPTAKAVSPAPEPAPAATASAGPQAPAKA